MKKYLLGFDNEGMHILGYTTVSSFKTIKKNKELSNQLIKDSFNKIKNVYMINKNEYIQKVCEMNKKDFSNYIKKIGVKLV